MRLEQRTDAILILAERWRSAGKPEPLAEFIRKSLASSTIGQRVATNANKPGKNRQTTFT